jgi:serine/threonine protein kinase/Tfp pilus assembly protein PilF
MEFVDGATIRQKIPVQKLPEALTYAIQIGDALQEAHSRGIVHRDIKSENIMVNSKNQIKVMDFGLAKLKGSMKLTKTSSTVGTLAYMAPEQIQGGEADSRSDIFAFGVLLFEMLTGRLPFRGEHEAAIMYSIVNEEPQSIEQFNNNVPSGLTQILKRALEKNPDARYQSMQDVVNDLSTLQSGGTLPSASTHREGRRRFTGNPKLLRPVILIPVLVVLAAAVAGLLLFGRGGSTIDSIAVLPFQNKSSDADTEYLSDGLSESLIYRLSQLPNLKVSPTSSVFRYKGKEVDATRIGNELGVNAVMSGRIVQRGQSLTISVELVDVRNNKLLWGEQYERTLSDLLATQREIAGEITQRLQLKLSGEDQKGLTKHYTDNNEAYQLYLKGCYHLAKKTKDDILKGIEYFQQAIKLDPNYALAYAGIADSYNATIVYPYLSPKEAIPQAKAAAQRALEIDPTLAEAHTALANSLAAFDWNWVEAEREFKRALELNPNDSGTHWRYGMYYLMPLGRSDEAIAEVKRAQELEPLDLTMGSVLSWAYMSARQYDRALDQAQKIFDLEPNFPLGRWILSQAYISKGMYADAIALNEKSLQTDPTNQVFLRFAGYAYTKSGRRREAEEVIKKFKDIAKTQYVMSYWIASIYAALGDKDKAFVELEKAFEERDWEFHRLKVDPFMDPLRDDPRFADLLKKVGLEK